jgi:hypothetical protein
VILRGFSDITAASLNYMPESEPSGTELRVGQIRFNRVGAQRPAM